LAVGICLNKVRSKVALWSSVLSKLRNVNAGTTWNSRPSDDSGRSWRHESRSTAGKSLGTADAVLLFWRRKGMQMVGTNERDKADQQAPSVDRCKVLKNSESRRNRRGGQG